MRYIPTPWRERYVRNTVKAKGCALCEALRRGDDRKSGILYRGVHHFIILNRYPYTTGHLLIVANRHISFLTEASSEELQEIIAIGQQCENALRQEYHPNGYNLGFNLGRAAGAGIEHHLHMHVLPRWVGDSNFVCVVGETLVLPEVPPAAYQR